MWDYFLFLQINFFSFLLGVRVGKVGYFYWFYELLRGNEYLKRNIISASTSKKFNTKCHPLLQTHLEPKLNSYFEHLNGFYDNRWKLKLHWNESWNWLYEFLLEFIMASYYLIKIHFDFISKILDVSILYSVFQFIN